jgi:hypothetical protein
MHHWPIQFLWLLYPKFSYQLDGMHHWPILFLWFHLHYRYNQEGEGEGEEEHYYRGLQKNEELLRLLLPATEEHSCLLNKRNKDKLLRIQEDAQRHAAEVEAARQHDLQLEQLAEQERQAQAAAVQAAVAVEPIYHDPPRHIDIQAALQERNRREQEWIQQVHAMWRNERLAEDQVQLDELEELQRISIEERNLQQRIIRLDQLGNNMSRDQIDEYHAAPPRPLPPARAPYQEPHQRHSLGPMNVQCPQCSALHFDCEKLASSTRRVLKFGSCCLQGQVQLPPFRPAPGALRDLLCGRSPLSKQFKSNIRQYNSAFAFTSLGVDVDHAVTNASGAYAFRIHGDLHHLAGALIPPPGLSPVFAQIYIHDPVAQMRLRTGENPNLNSVIMTELQAVLNDTHPYVPLYKQAFQIMREKPPEEHQNVTIRLRADRSQDLRVYNLPTANDEVAAIIPGDGSRECSDARDIVVRLQGGGLRRISQLHPSYATLHYVLLFPHGEDGWHKDIPSHARTDRKKKNSKCQPAMLLFLQVAFKARDSASLTMGWQSIAAVCG